MEQPGMNAVYYTDKSIAVFGDTKPWVNELKQLGGKFNSRLTGGAGWIFPKSKEQELVQFINNANGGLLQPEGSGTQLAKLQPRTTMQPAMSPRTALNKLQSSQQQTQMSPRALTTQQAQISARPSYQQQLQQPQQQLQQLQQMQQQSQQQMQRQSQPIKPASTLQSQPIQLNYPNLFLGADGLQYQIIVMTVPNPVVGQHVTVKVEEVSIPYVVSEIEKNTHPNDQIIISSVQQSEGDEINYARAFIKNGEWQIEGMDSQPHKLIFHQVE